MPNDALKPIKSGISRAFWCEVDDNIAEFKPACIAFDTTEPEEISWFDSLFEGGLRLPVGSSDPPRPLTMLVSGPPGSGKTTLVSELCYRLARNEQGNDRPLSSLYISIDAETDRLINNAIDLGWEDAENFFIPFDTEDKKTKIKKGLRSVVAVWGREKFLKAMKKDEVFATIVQTAVESLNTWILRAKPKSLMENLDHYKYTRPLTDAANVTMDANTGEKYIPDVLVVDSLNILNPDNQVGFFENFVQACRASRLVIFMLDAGSNNEQHKLWEYFSDIVISLDYNYVHDYYMRTIEVVKARYQSHRWGKHQLKVYPRPKPLPKPSASDQHAILEYNVAMRRAHPYRKSGGVFIFPSIHSYLSVYKRKTSSEEPGRDDTYPEKLNDVFQLPKGRCTAFIGERGGHKSHLGYLHVLYRLIKHRGESGLIISLRDDEAVTKKTLKNIAQVEFNEESRNSAWGKDGEFDMIDLLEKENHLEVLYFPPGYITPEEFYHRMFISIQRLKKNRSPLTVLFNSLDQITARFPLCAKEEIFIPSIIQALSGEGITSICIAVDEPGQPIQQYGLLPMADLIVSFSQRRFPMEDYYLHLNNVWKFDDLPEDDTLRLKADAIQSTYQKRHAARHEAVVLQVIRFSGGERAGRRGILELIKTSELEKFPYPKEGLHFTPLSEELSQGDLFDLRER